MITLKKQHRRYGKYRDSGVEWLGEIPEEWKLERLKFSAQVNPSKTEAKMLSDKLDVSFIPMEMVSEWGKIDLTETKILEEVRDGYSYFTDDSVIIAKITPCFENGKGAVVNGLNNSIGFGSTEFIVLRAKKDISPNFLYYITRAHGFRKTGEVEMRGSAGQKRIPDEFIKNFRVPKLSYRDQSSIASFLDEKCTLIDRIIEGKKKQIELLKEQRAAIINRAVTKGLDEGVEMKDPSTELRAGSGVEWIGEIPKGWEVIRLGKLTTKMTNGFVGPTRDIFFESGVKYLQSLHIKNNRIIFDTEYYVSEQWSSEHSKSILREGDLLFVQTGDIGQVALVTKHFEGANCHALIITRPNQKYLVPEYLVWYFLSHLGKEQLIAHQTGAMHPHLNCRVIKYIPVIIPSKSEQLEIAKFLEIEDSHIRKIIGLVEHSISFLNEYKTSLIAHAVTGSVKVS